MNTFFVKVQENTGEGTGAFLMLHRGVACDVRNTLVHLFSPPYVRTGVWVPLLEMSFGSFFFLLHFTSTSRGWQCYCASVNGKVPIKKKTYTPHLRKIQPENLTFMGPCIVIYFYNKSNEMHNFSSLLNITLHVSDGFSVHHQEFKTVHTASGICRTGSLTAC